MSPFVSLIVSSSYSTLHCIRLTSQGYHIFMVSLPLRPSDTVHYHHFAWYWLTYSYELWCSSTPGYYTQRILVCSALSCLGCSMLQLYIMDICLQSFRLTLRTTPMVTLGKNWVCTIRCGGSDGRQGMGMWRNESSIGGGPIASRYN